MMHNLFSIKKMNSYCRVSVILFIVGSFFLFKEGLAIKCWYCNSMLDPYCRDPFDNSTANPKDCSITGELPHLRGVPADMCRKIRMKVNGQWRFKRDCARLGEPGLGGDARYCIHRTGTYNIHMEYCTCNDKDGCNAASKHSTMSYVWASMFGMLLPFAYFRC